ncbi:glycosyltransferase [Brevundimonas naejangsanensis]|uniref:glycosyltransferase n=1 Tax=Brevundimonas naejangsanensis TaxID=588932 RepID=UPI00106B6676|nr:glycosyltransferase [Brevundimonas naejangsanensis]QBQ47233.1 glycosyltransferase [Brevundimonas naejangsanensis]
MDNKPCVAVGERPTADDAGATAGPSEPTSAITSPGPTGSAVKSAPRPIILTFAGSYLPGFKAGGPIRSLANMADCLSDEFDFRIVAPDRDLGDATAYPGVQVNRWNTVGRAEVFYRSPGAAGWRALVADLQGTDYDLIYLNSFFSTDSSLRPLLYKWLGKLKKKPVLLAPRGEFSQGALALKPIKKSLFIGLVRALNVYRDITFQASSEHEATDIQRALGVSADVRAGVHVASDLASPRSDAGPLPRERDTPSLKAVFLSRISPMKNLDGAISVLSKLACPLQFDVYGPVEDDGYWKRCSALISELPKHITVEYKGKVHPTDVQTILSGYDFFFLPTRGENYGHVIREALSAGLPVLISDQTPWKNLATVSAGADLPLAEPDAFTAWIEAFSRLSVADCQAMREGARRLGDDPVKAAHDLEANRAMLLVALGRAGTADGPREPG